MQVANNLLPEDLQEMEGLGHSVLGLFFSFYASDPCLAFFNKYGDIAGLGGISYVSPIEGSIWMICTPHIKKNPVTFVKQCKKWLSEQKQYKILTNKVDARNKFHHKLLLSISSSFFQDSSTHYLRSHMIFLKLQMNE